MGENRDLTLQAPPSIFCILLQGYVLPNTHNSRLRWGPLSIPLSRRGQSIRICMMDSLFTLHRTLNPGPCQILFWRMFQVGTLLLNASQKENLDFIGAFVSRLVSTTSIPHGHYLETLPCTQSWPCTLQLAFVTRPIHLAKPLVLWHRYWIY